MNYITISPSIRASEGRLVLYDLSSRPNTETRTRSVTTWVMTNEPRGGPVSFLVFPWFPPSVFRWAVRPVKLGLGLVLDV